MAKRTKSIFIVLFGIFAFLFAGFSFVGCGIDYSKISITTQTESITLEKGESKDIYFEIKNYQKGFEKVVSISEKSGNGTIGSGNGSKSTRTFKFSSPTYLSDGRIKVTVTGLAGGNSTLSAFTLDGGKECLVDISVTQYAEKQSEMNSLNELLYVSDDIDFIPDAGLFEFDANVTYKDLSYYVYEKRGDFNLSVYNKLLSVTDDVATFTDGTDLKEATIKKFDCVKFDGEKLIFLYGETEREADFVDKFGLLSVYNYSVGSQGYAKQGYDQIIYVVDDVYVLPKLQMTISGGYNINGIRTYMDLEDGQRVIVVPNNAEMSDFVVKIEVENTISSSPVRIECYQNVPGESEHVQLPSLLVDNLNNFAEPGDEESDKLIEYWHVISRAQVPGELEFGFKVSYDLGRKFRNDDINETIGFIGELQVAPTSIMVNETTDPRFTLYNYYTSLANNGWVDMEIGVSTDYGVSPTYDGIYFTYDTNVIEIIYSGNGAPVAPNSLYSDLSVPFKMRAPYGATPGETEIVLHLKSSILQGVEELTLPIRCEIVKGADTFVLVTSYQSREAFYIDVDAPAQTFENMFYANEAFKSVTAKFASGVDVAEFIFDDATPYTIIDEGYYVNFAVKAKTTGTGFYRLVLDNGVPTEQLVQIRAIRTLKEETTSIKLAGEGNKNVTYYDYSRTEGTNFDNVLNVEVLNPSDRENITFGTATTIVISANTIGSGGIEATLSNDTVTISTMSGGHYLLSTTKNGDVVAEFVLHGYKIEDFVATDDVTLNVYVNLTSYSVLSEFYFMHGKDYANPSKVYFGENATIDDNSLALSVVANNPNASNFYKYNLTNQALMRLFDEADDYHYDAETDKYSSISLRTSDLQLTLTHEVFNRKFIYYNVQDKYGDDLNVSTEIVLTKVTRGAEDRTETKTLILSDKGLMFMGDDFEFDFYDEDTGDLVATYSVVFSNVYTIDIGYGGVYDLASLTYMAGDDIDTRPVIINATISQRGFAQKSNKMYSMEITPVEFKPVESISLASNLTKLNFSSSKLTYTVGVYTYPTTSTNKSVKVQFVKDAENKYSDLISYSVDDSQSANGIYMITISCANFYNQHLTGSESIEKITCPLTGTIYIYPKEWGNSYTVIGARKPVVLDVQYRNGSKANPYLLESADDVVEMGKNEVMLRSHYEINSVVDMSSVKNFVPIGILNGEVVGFSGTLIGSSSQAGITNISVSNNNFSYLVGENLFGGLFAQINAGAIVENVILTGKFNIETENSAKIGLLAATNLGKIINSGATIRESSITANEDLYFGGLVAVNEGYIYQDFKKYSNEEAATSTSSSYNPGYTYNKLSNIEQDAETGEYFAWKGGVRYTTDRDGYQIYSNGTRVVIDNERNALPVAWRYDGQVSKNMANFTGFVNISSSAKVYAGGVAGTTKGEIKRFLPTLTYNMYGYAGYSAITQIKVSGNVSQVYLGGVVGNVLPSAQGVVIDNLLVGGEVDSSMITSGKDSVGGLLGRTESGQITISNNTIRTFVRGMHYVGGIAGYENYNSTTGGVTWGTENKLEAVDDGRNAFYSAMIIKYFAADYNMTTDEERISGAYFYAVGFYGGRDYSSISNPASFGKFSYLKRTSIASATNVDRGNTSTTTYYGNYLAVYLSNFTYISDLTYEGGIYAFVEKNIELIVSGPNKLDEDVFFMYYFGVDSMLNDANQAQSIVQDQVAELNFISTASTLYPFSLSSAEVKFSAAESNILSFDANQNISVMGCGLSTISLSSILNVNVRKLVYVYVVNYFNKSVDKTIYHTSATSNGKSVTEDSIINIYGNSATSIYIVPNYQLADTRTSNGNMFSITDDGVLSFKNVSYALSKNTLITSSADRVEGDEISAVQVNKQTIVFRRVSGAQEDKVDRYMLTPMLQISFVKDGEVATYEYTLNGSRINVNVVYKEAAKSIKPKFDFNAMETNNTLQDLIYVDSTNSSEKLFYQIYKLTDDGQRIIVQDKMPLATSEVDSYTITILDDDLFDLTLQRVSADNTFEYTLKVNKNSVQFANRLNQNIYGEYVVILYASQLLEGKTGYFTFRLDEANVNYVSLTNHSDSADISISDQIVVPAQAGLLEIAVDPVEAAFNQITISNNENNSKNGVGIATFTFVYEKKQDHGVIEYVRVPAFAKNVNGSMTFTYEDLQDFLQKEGQTYKGKVYIEYLLPAYNLQDGMIVAFDVAVEHGEENEIHSATIELVTKLSSYARLEIVGKESVGDSYYVARGLSYDLALSYYGYLESEIAISTTNEALASISHENGKYKLNISTIQPSREADRDIDIVTHAEKIVDDKTIFYEHIIRIHIMEYVFNYAYSEDKNEDIVKGMKNGVIDDAIGTPYTLELFVNNYIEYDTTSNEIAEEVATFVERLTNAVAWKVYLYDEGTDLETGKSIRTDFYTIKSFTFTPLKIYNADSGIYYFSASAKYSISVGGLYSVSADGNYQLYTEFSFDVHQQSTEESPVPIETYEEFSQMKAGEWYILMQDIVLPNMYSTKQFEPIAEEIAGLDGNSHNLIFTGDYTFEDRSSIGVFEFIGEDAVVKNLNVLIVNDSVFNLNVESFTFGVIAAENRGVVTNCSTRSVGNALLSVHRPQDDQEDTSSADLTDAYVAGLVSTNSGFITHSRSQVNIITPANIAGFVAQNSGHIASSYFMGASLTNTARSNYIAGFVIENSGDIYTSYTSGNPTESVGTSGTDADAKRIYYNGVENMIKSAGYIAGFVFENEGNVCDCYSNLNMSNDSSSGSDIAGFVFENAGTIKRCISTSLLKSNATKSFGFVREITSTDNQTATFEDCFYLSDAEEGVNVSMEANRAENVKELNIAGFANLNNFKSFAIANGRDINAVWFFSTTTGGDNFNGATFLANRLELVAPNILATSIRQLDHIENVVDEESGAAYAKYVYVYTEASPKLGSMYNPIVIYDYETMENYIVNENNRAGQNYGFYRIVKDVDYSEDEDDSGLYKTRFLGYMEGNFTDVNNISLISNETLTSAGLFAELGNSGDRNAYGTIMNLTIVPKKVSFNNTKLVGGLAGKMDSATLYNLNLIYSNDPVIVSGKNVVGGVVGIAMGNYKMQNVYSNLGARASHVTGNESTANIYNESTPDYGNYSYAGTIAGILSGTGYVYDSRLKDSDEVAVLADKAGLMFGLATSSVKVEKLIINMNSNMILNAYTYGGLVVGQSSATLIDVHVIGSGIQFTNVRKVPFIPTAIGGIVGLLSGGSLTNVSNTQSIVVASRGDSAGVKYLGGIAGLVSKSVQISQVSVGVLEDEDANIDEESAEMYGFMYVGGAVGGVTSGILKIVDVDICTSLSGGGRSQTKIGVGGLVGFVDEPAQVELTTSTARYNIEKPNMIVVKNIDVAVYCYGESDVIVNVGSVLGFNAALVRNTLLSTNSFINKGDVQMYEFSTEVTQYSGKYIYKDKATNPAQYVTSTIIESTGCASEITELTYNLPLMNDGSAIRALYMLNINIVGSEYKKPTE